MSRRNHSLQRGRALVSAEMMEENDRPTINDLLQRGRALVSAEMWT